MLATGLLDKIDFTEEMKAEYAKYKEMLGDKLEPLVDLYMNNGVEIAEIIEELKKMQTPQLHEYTLNVMFLLECTGILYDRYKAEGISEEIFYDTMKDIKYKVVESYDVYGIFGNFVIGWMDGFFKMTRFAFGRMQFDMCTHPCEAVEVAGYTVNEGDFIIKGHVPSSGSLLHEECMKSYKAAYDFARDRFEGDVLPVEFWSWMLFPHYKDFFGESSNTGRFIADYKVFGYYETDQFHDAWRFFGKDAGSDNLPTKTSLQRKFVEYMGPGKTYGYGKGIFMFDGENIFK